MNLYSRRKFLASLACAILSLLAFASIDAQQRRKAHKLRATAVLEVTTDPVGVVSTRVIPVTILSDGNFYDAGTYKASPRPMALDNGIVYEAQKSGVAAGFVTIDKSVNNNGWTASGKWQPVTTAKKAEPTPTPVNIADQRPILHHGDAGTAATVPSVPSPSASPTPVTVPDHSSPSSSSSSADSERPVLRRRESEKPDASPSPTPAAAPAQAEGTVPKAPLPVVAAGTRTMVGISDTQSVDPRSFDFVWKPGEEQQMEGKMRKLLLSQLPRENAQLPPSALKNVVMHSFDLDLSNDAVLVMSAEVPGSYLAPGAKNAPAASSKFVDRYVTVIARVDFEGVPQKLASSVTDSTRLDVAPRLELIDAVDVDGDGLAELLFRQYSFDEKSFIIYGVGRNSVTKVFEGASTSLK
ncbi:MAG TPA: hypothetical protein VIB39_13905 [Candidatus Angelobacter sp.]|jgi:hypothetical protein